MSGDGGGRLGVGADHSFQPVLTPPLVSLIHVDLRESTVYGLYVHKNKLPYSVHSRHNQRGTVKICSFFSCISYAFKLSKNIVRRRQVWFRILSISTIVWIKFMIWLPAACCLLQSAFCFCCCTVQSITGKNNNRSLRTRYFVCSSHKK